LTLLKNIMYIKKKLKTVCKSVIKVPLNNKIFDVILRFDSK